MVMFYPKKYQESKLPSSHTLGEGLEVPLQYKTGTPGEVEVDKLAKEFKKKKIQKIVELLDKEGKSVILTQDGLINYLMEK